MKIDRNNPLAGSSLKRTILELIPGVDRKADRLISNLSKLTLKTSRVSECRRREFVSTFEKRRSYREKLYERLRPKLDPSVRVAIDRMKEGQTINGSEKRRKTKLKRQKISKTTRGKTCAIDSSDAQGEQQSLNSLDWTSETGLDFSRRSSLKSSIFDIGLSRSGSPGPIHTEDPLSSIIR